MRMPVKGPNHDQNGEAEEADDGRDGRLQQAKGSGSSGTMHMRARMEGACM